MGLLDVIADIIKAKQDKKDSQVIVKNYINGNNTQNNNNNNNNKNSNNKTNAKTQKPHTDNKISTNTTSTSNESISLEKIKLYCTGAKGKVYSKVFYKSVNSDFGVEVIIRNNTPKLQNVKLGHCIYDKSGNNTMFQKTLYIKINPHSSFTQRIRVSPEDFSKMKTGEYKSQLWINDEKVQRVFFTIKNK